jgi:hypothetical protein
MTPLEKIRANAQLIINKAGPISGLGSRFGYNRESVAWIEGYIERCRNTPEFSRDGIPGLVEVLGSYVGECVIHVYGGEWREHSDTWGVFFDDKNCVFPFAKVHKQFDNGIEGGDSILGFFEIIPEVFMKKT